MRAGGSEVGAADLDGGLGREDLLVCLCRRLVRTHGGSRYLRAGRDGGEVQRWRQAVDDGARKDRRARLGAFPHLEGILIQRESRPRRRT